jgi:hypothetical protein
VVRPTGAGALRKLSDTPCAGRDALSTTGGSDVRKVQLSTTKPPSLVALSDEADTSTPTNISSVKRAPSPGAWAASAGARGRRLAWLRNTSRHARRAS